MQLRDIMTAGAQTVSRDETVHRAAEMMRDLDVGALPVQGDDRIVGIVTDRDITVRATAAGSSPDQTRVSEVMTQGVEIAYEDEDVDRAAKTMKDKQIRRLVVVNRSERLVGMVSLGDLVVKSGDTSMSGEVLSGVSNPS